MGWPVTPTSGVVHPWATTRVCFVHHIELYLNFGLGHVRLSDLRDTDFEELYGATRLIGRPRTGPPSAMLERLLGVRTDTKQGRRPLTPNRIRTVHTTIRSALNAAVKRQPIAHSPALYVELETRGQAACAGWGGWDSNPGPRDYESLALTG
jgi:hypothetical protein